MVNIYEYFDITGGDQDLSGYGFPEIHKYDASSFYNWEQDNLPILDLETRSNVIKQYLGVNTTLTGVTLTVSAGAPKSASDSGTFPTIQKALDVIPRRLRFPLLIEILDFGDLGDLEIADIHCEGDGALQIVCRQFAQDVSAQVIAVSASYTYGPSATQAFPTSFSSSALSSDITSASSTKLSLNCSADEPWNRHARVYFQRMPDSQAEPQNLGFAPFPRANSETFIADSTTFTFNCLAYNQADDVTVSADANPLVENSGALRSSLLASRLKISADDYVSVVAYGAYFRRVKIINCSRVKLQNVCVDSASGADFSYPDLAQFLCDRGVDIRNSNVVLENVSVSRFNRTGVYAQDSVVNVAKSFVVNRVYERTINKTRPSNGVGVYLSDSTFVFDTSAYPNGGKHLVSIAKCGVGVHALNSTVMGGAKSSVTDDDSYPKNAGGDDTETSKFYISNSDLGFKLENSLFDYDGRSEIFCNLKGLQAFDSTVILPQFSVDYNQGDGFFLSKSILRYGKFYDYLSDNGSVSATNGAATPKPAFTGDYNGINVHAARGSSVTPVEDCSSIPKLGMWGGSYSGTGHNGVTQLAMTSHGVRDDVSTARVPALLVEDNSNAEFVNLGFAGEASMGAVPGACALANKNSNITFRGTAISTTCIGSYGTLGTTALRNNWTTAATAAIDNSQLVFTGPTKIGRFGICVLADKNSNISFGPPTKDSYGWIPDSSKYSLDSSANHTMVDLHSSRSCLVANAKSVIDLVGLGGSALDASNTVDVLALSGSDVFNAFTAATSSSYLRMFPNGFTENAAGTSQVGADDLDLFTRTSMALTDDSLHPAGTTGGMCVRAVGSSKVNLNLVNFKSQLDASSVSGVVYNYFGTGCEYNGSAVSGVASSPTSDLCASIATMDCCASATVATATATNTTTQSSTSLTDNTTTTATSTITATATPTTTYSTQTEAACPPGIEGVPASGAFVDGIYTNAFGTTNAASGYPISGDLDSRCVGTQIHLWNIADNSRIHAANVLINGLSPSAASISQGWHGPTGRWLNGAACDYYGKFGLAASAFDASGLSDEGTSDGFYNLGMFRIVGSHRGYLKMYGEVDYGGATIASQYTGGGSPMDQAGSQGYQVMFDTAVGIEGAPDVTKHIGLEGGASPGMEPVFGRGLAGLSGEPGKINGLVTHAPMVEGLGMVWDLGQLHPQFPIPPINLGWQGYTRNWLDESAACLFANAKHAANKKVNLLSIYRSNTLGLRGGEGRDSSLLEGPTYGVGVKSLNMFDLDRLL